MRRLGCNGGLLIETSTRHAYTRHDSTYVDEPCQYNQSNPYATRQTLQVSAEESRLCYYSAHRDHLRQLALETACFSISVSSRQVPFFLCQAKRKRRNRAIHYASSTLRSLWRTRAQSHRGALSPLFRKKYWPLLWLKRERVRERELIAAARFQTPKRKFTDYAYRTKEPLAMSNRPGNAPLETPPPPLMSVDADDAAAHCSFSRFSSRPQSKTEHRGTLTLTFFVQGKGKSTETPEFPHKSSATRHGRVLESLSPMMQQRKRGRA